MCFVLCTLLILFFFSFNFFSLVFPLSLSFFRSLRRSEAEYRILFVGWDFQIIHKQKSNFLDIFQIQFCHVLFRKMLNIAQMLTNASFKSNASESKQTNGKKDEKSSNYNNKCSILL